MRGRLRFRTEHRAVPFMARAHSGEGQDGLVRRWELLVPQCNQTPRQEDNKASAGLTYCTCGPRVVGPVRLRDANVNLALADATSLERWLVA